MDEKSHSQDFFSQLQADPKFAIFSFLSEKELAAITRVSKDVQQRDNLSNILRFLKKETNNEGIHFLENYFVTRLLQGGLEKLSKDLDALGVSVGRLYRASLIQKGSKPTLFLLTLITAMQMNAMKMDDVTEAVEKQRLLSLLKYMALKSQGALAVTICLSDRQAIKEKAISQWEQERKETDRENPIFICRKYPFGPMRVRFVKDYYMVVHRIVSNLSEEEKLAIINELIIDIYAYGSSSNTARVLEIIACTLKSPEEKQKIIDKLIDQFNEKPLIANEDNRIAGNIAVTISSEKVNRDIINKLLTKLGELRKTGAIGVTLLALSIAARSLGSEGEALIFTEKVSRQLDYIDLPLRLKINQVRKSVVLTGSTEENKREIIGELIQSLTEDPSFIDAQTVEILSCTLSKEMRLEIVKKLIPILINNDFDYLRDDVFYAVEKIACTFCSEKYESEIGKMLISEINKIEGKSRFLNILVNLMIRLTCDEKTKKSFFLQWLNHVSWSYSPGLERLDLEGLVTIASSIKDNSFFAQLSSDFHKADHNKFLTECQCLFEQTQYNLLEERLRIKSQEEAPHSQTTLVDKIEQFINHGRNLLEWSDPDSRYSLFYMNPSQKLEKAQVIRKVVERYLDTNKFEIYEGERWILNQDNGIKSLLPSLFRGSTTSSELASACADDLLVDTDLKMNM